PVRLRGLDEALGDDRRRRDAAFLKLYAVVETPRCAGASIGDAVDDHPAVFGEVAENLGPGALAGVALLVADEIDAAELRGQALLQPVEDLAGAVLVVVEHADREAVALDALGGFERGGGDEADRDENTDLAGHVGPSLGALCGQARAFRQSTILI